MHCNHHSDGSSFVHTMYVIQHVAHDCIHVYIYKSVVRPAYVWHELSNTAGSNQLVTCCFDIVHIV